LVANRLNALKSTGPRTDEGKERCRGNALKHGLTGAGVVLPKEDEEAIEARFSAYEKELGGEGEVGRDLARRAAMMMVRMERASEHEAAMLSRKIRVAEALYDEERKTFVDDVAAGLHETPATVVRRLRAMPEGIDWLIGAWKGVKADLMNPNRDAFHGRHWNRMENLMGRRQGDIPESDVERLCQAAWGNFGKLAEGEGTGLTPEARKQWARGQIAAWIDEQVAELEALRSTLDQTRAEIDRADAGRRALFDPSPQATLARKYEAAAERGFYRALKELKEMRDLEAQARAIEAEAAAIEAKAALGPFFPEGVAVESQAMQGDRARAEAHAVAKPDPVGPPAAIRHRRVKKTARPSSPVGSVLSPREEGMGSYATPSPEDVSSPARRGPGPGHVPVRPAPPDR